ncbi:hypothetical protein NL676_004944 [Syzygium grande]|nr:hypothetical protein NL676_004944 [Syzygium grande]
MDPWAAEILFIVSCIIDGAFEVGVQPQPEEERIGVICILERKSAGTGSAPASVFARGLDDGISAKSFKTDLSTIQKIQAGLATRARNRGLEKHVLLFDAFVQAIEYVAD